VDEISWCRLGQPLPLSQLWQGPSEILLSAESSRPRYLTMLPFKLDPGQTDGLTMCPCVSQSRGGGATCRCPLGLEELGQDAKKSPEAQGATLRWAGTRSSLSGGEASVTGETRV
jgi:hypothetical protein